MLLTTVMLFAGGCGNLVKPASVEPAETAEGADTEESLEQTPEESIDRFN